jgi:antirestriction protein ArdC
MTTKFERRDIAAEVTEKLIAALEAGTLPWRKPWATEGATIGGLPYSVTSRARYRGINVLLLSLSQSVNGFRSSGWMTYNAAQEVGAHVRKGEKGTLVTFYKTLEKNERNEATGEDETKRIPLLRHFTAFNLDQIDDLPESIVAKHMPSAADMASTDVADWLATRLPGVTVKHGYDHAAYYPSHDEIRMPARSAFTSEAAYVGTLLHEATHATGAKNRLDRLNDYGSDDGRAFEELVADIGASMLCAALGRDFDLGEHASYVASWLKILKNDKRAIFRAAAAAQKAVDMILPAEEADEGEAVEPAREAA